MNTFRTGHPPVQGFGLIELLVALAIGLMLMVVLVSMFVNSRRNEHELALAAELIDNGRYALQLIESDLMHAGFWGVYVPQFDDQTLATVPVDVPALLPDPCLPRNATNWNTAYVEALLGVPVQGYDTAAVCSGLVTDRQANTDVLVVRHAETCVPGTGNCEADTAGRLYFQTSRCSGESPAYLLTDTGFTLHDRDCTTIAEKRRFISSLYYVRNYARTAGDGIPLLMLSRFDLSGGGLAQQPAVALIEGIEALRIEFGIDDRVGRCNPALPIHYDAAIARVDPATCTENAIDAAANTLPANRGDGTPDDTFVHCSTAAPCTAGQMMNVVAARLYVLARSREPSPGYTDRKTYTLGPATLGPYNDAYRRHLFSTTVRLVNVSARRISP